MFEMLYTYAFKWLYYNDPMTETEPQNWGRTRKRGIAIFASCWSFALCALILVPDLCWDLYVEHKSVNGRSVALRAAVYLLVSCIIAIGNWYVDEKRYRLPQKLTTPAMAQINKGLK